LAAARGGGASPPRSGPRREAVALAQCTVAARGAERGTMRGAAAAAGIFFIFLFDLTRP